jgi:hypothetical protein
MGFERFIKKGRSYKPRVSIWSRGQIGFNQGAVEKHNLNSYTYAILFYDEHTKRVGIQFTNDESEAGAIKLVKRTAGFSFSARAFLDSIDYDYSKTKKYDMEFDQEAQLFIIQI